MRSGMFWTLLLAWWALASGCAGASANTQTLNFGDTTLRVEVVATQAERARGLMYRKHLGNNDGMLFVYPDTAPRSFWMKDTTLPLSIAFINKRGKILRIREMTPLDIKPVKSVVPASYAVEVNRGWFEANGVAVGDIVKPLPPLASE